MTKIMGVVNVTPDSFSDGGRYLDARAAIAHGLALADAGAHLVDVGGESTRPGAERIDGETEAARVLPVISALAGEGLIVSVDTMRASVAEQALHSGATVVNDVSGGLADPTMANVVAASGAGWILGHWRAHAAGAAEEALYTDVVAEVLGELSDRVEGALEEGVDRDRLILDPGLGFSKSPHHNWELLRRLETLFTLGFPILIGASRKSFLGSLLADEHGAPRPSHQRDAATLAVTLHAARIGAWGVRVHDVAATADALAVWEQLESMEGLDE
jgi:dihydropteroate synthase